MAAIGQFRVLFLINFLSFAHSSLSAEVKPIPVPPCFSDNHVCNILASNGTGGSSTLRQVCSCTHGKICPRTILDDSVAVIMADKWFLTCSHLDTVPVCDQGQVSLLSVSDSTADEENFQVLCACPKGYNADVSKRTLDRGKIKIEVYCKENQSNDAHDVTGNGRVEISNIPQEDDHFYEFVEANEKKRKDESAFYKRSGDNEQIFYTGDQVDIPEFHKRHSDSESSFYKRAPFYKRDAFYKREPTISKRSVNNFSAFYKRSPFNDFNAISEEDSDDDELLDENDKDIERNLVHTPDFSDGFDSFYKRSQNGLSSFYKKSLNTPSISSTEDVESNNLPTPEEDSLDAMSLEKKASMGGLNSFYKRSLSSFYKRSPLYNNKGTSSFYKKRGWDGDNTVFYKRNHGSALQSFDKRGMKDNFSAFYKRGGYTSGLSSFYKRDLGGSKGTYGLSSFYKRDLNDKGSQLYILDGEHALDVLEDAQKTSEHTNGLEKRNAEVINNKKRSVRSLSSFYKRDPYDKSFSNFYKRAPSDYSVSSFYKRAPSDYSISSFYKRAPYDNSFSNFYKRAPSDYLVSNFYKRVPSEFSVSSFYKRGPFDNSVSSFYKRAPSDSSISSFYKRDNYDLSNFYKRGFNDLDAFYKRGISDLSAFYKRRPPTSSTMSNFYKRFGNGLNAFYKRSSNDHGFNDKTSKEDLENVLTKWRENGFSLLHNANEAGQNHLDSISNADREVTLNK